MIIDNNADNAEDDDDNGDDDEYGDDDDEDYDDDDGKARRRTWLLSFHVMCFGLRISSQTMCGSVVVGDTENLQIIYLCNDKELSSAQVYRDCQWAFCDLPLSSLAMIMEGWGGSWDNFGVHSSAPKERWFNADDALNEIVV